MRQVLDRVRAVEYTSAVTPKAATARQPWLRIALAVVTCGALGVLGNTAVLACTAFCAALVHSSLRPQVVEPDVQATERTGAFAGTNQIFVRGLFQSSLLPTSTCPPPVRFDLADELKKGARVLDIPALFPRNAAAETFAASRQNPALLTPEQRERIDVGRPPGR